MPISHAVARANGVVINHLGETMDAVISNVKLMGRYAFQTVSEKLLEFLDRFRRAWKWLSQICCGRAEVF